MSDHISPRRRTAWLIAVMVTLNLSLTTAVLAAGGAFTDDDTSVFEADIEWLAESGVTRGCNPPDNDLFCPEDTVTRGQMAAFMHRFARYLDMEDGFDRSSLARVAAFSTDDDVDDWDGSAIEDEVTVTAPSSGTLLVDYMFNWGRDLDETGSDYIDYLFEISLDGSVVGGSMWSGQDFAQAPATYDSKASTFVRAIPVDAGEHTVAASAQRFGGASTSDLAYVYARTLTVTFVAHDGSGAIQEAAVPQQVEPSGPPQP